MTAGVTVKRTDPEMSAEEAVMVVVPSTSPVARP
jgi:hypothetical protein